MLERFHVPDDIAIRVDHLKLKNVVEKIFQSRGISKKDSKIAADVLLAADIKGVDTHGVSNMLRRYLQYYDDGIAKPDAKWKIIRETASCATVDCDEGLGLIVAPQCMDIAIEKAKKTGVGMVSMGNGRHLGMAGYHAAKALEHDMIGVCMTSSSSGVVPTFASKAVLGTNPIALAAPAKDEVPFIFDAATSTIATNKIRLAQRLGVQLAPGWVADKNGNPIMENFNLKSSNDPDEERLLQLPLGATRELGSHKGYSLGVVVDILGSILNGNLAGPLSNNVLHQNHFVAAYSVEAFIDIDVFKALMDKYLKSLRELPTAPGHERVLYAGLPEHEESIERLEGGIPLHPEVISWFENICSELKIDFDIIK